MKKTTLSALSLVIALTAGSAFAEDKPLPPKDGKPPHERAGGPMKDADTDGDHTISKAEWSAKSEKAFAEIDTNKDGKLTPDELKAHHEKKREQFKERREEFKEKREEFRKEHGDKKPAPDAPPAPEKH